MSKIAYELVATGSAVFDELSFLDTLSQMIDLFFELG